MTSHFPCIRVTFFLLEKLLWRLCQKYLKPRLLYVPKLWTWLSSKELNILAFFHWCWLMYNIYINDGPSNHQLLYSLLILCSFWSWTWYDLLVMASMDLSKINSNRLSPKLYPLTCFCFFIPHFFPSICFKRLTDFCKDRSFSLFSFNKKM